MEFYFQIAPLFIDFCFGHTLVPEALTWRERESKRKNPKRREGPLASTVENLTSMLVFGSDFETLSLIGLCNHGQVMYSNVALSLSLSPPTLGPQEPGYFQHGNALSPTLSIDFCGMFNNDMSIATTVKAD